LQVGSNQFIAKVLIAALSFTRDLLHCPSLVKSVSNTCDWTIQRVPD